MTAPRRRPRTVTPVETQVDHDMKPRIDGARSSGQSSRHRVRTVQPLPAYSQQIQIDAFVASKAFWAIAEEITKEVEATRSAVGRPCTTNAAAVVLTELVASVTGSIRSAIRYLDDQPTWSRLCQVAQQAWPNHPERRLPEQPATRSQHGRYVERHLAGTNDQVGTIRATVRRAAVDLIDHLDMFNPSAGAFTRPDTTQVIAGDGTVLNGMYNTSNPGVIDTETGEIRTRRVDHDATWSNSKEGNSPSYTIVDLVAQNSEKGERVIVDAVLRPKGTGEGTVFCGLVDQLQHDLTKHDREINAAVYDMALSAENHDHLLRRGIVPVSKVRLRKNLKPHEFNLGLCTFTLADGSKRKDKVVVVNGTPHINVAQIDGDTPVALIRKQTKRTRTKTGFRIGSFFEVPDIIEVPADLRNARVWINHHSKPDEVEREQRRTRNLRVFAPADPCYPAIAAIRENTESMHHHFKSTLTNRRARSVGANRVRLNFHTYQASVNIITALRHAERMDNWDMFGNWRPSSHAIALAA